MTMMAGEVLKPDYSLINVAQSLRKGWDAKFRFGRNSGACPFFPCYGAAQCDIFSLAQYRRRYYGKYLETKILNIA
jgi:hypothetical protein